MEKQASFNSCPEKILEFFCYKNPYYQLLFLISTVEHDKCFFEPVVRDFYKLRLQLLALPIRVIKICYKVH